MNRILAHRLAVLAFAPFGLALAQAREVVPVAVKTDNLAPHVAVAVQQKARQGVDELRRYVERTRMIHALYLPGLVQEEDGAVVAANEPVAQPVSAAAAPTGKTVLARASAAKSRTAVASSRQKLVLASAKGSRQAGAPAVKVVSRTAPALARA